MVGLNKIVALNYHSKTGLSSLLLKNFPDFIHIQCPLYFPDFSKFTLHWIAGFINADGSFYIRLKKKGTHILGVSADIWITQNNNSLIVLEQIIKFLGIGIIYNRKGKSINASDIKISNIKSINVFIENFNPSMFEGAKALDYLDFCNAVHLINNKNHLTKEGLNKVIKIKSGMNSNRK